jgi:hypothetical protein
MRVVLDTNIWISFFIGKAIRKLKRHLIESDVVVLTSDEQIGELLDVLKRPKFRRHLSSEDIEAMFLLIFERTERVEPKTPIVDCRDPKDNFILEIAVEGRADTIVTGDKDLLVMDPYRGIRILSASLFEKLL